MSYPEKSIGPDGRMMVGLRAVDAVYTVGGLALEFILTAEAWPVFYAWLCADDQQPAFATRDPLSVKADVQAVLDAMPPRKPRFTQRVGPLL